MSALWSQQLALDQNERFYLSRVDALDDMPYFSISKNHGKTWSEPIMIAAPGVDMASISAAFTSDGTAWASFTRDTCVIDESSDAVQCDGNFDYNGLRFYAVIARMEE